MDKPFKGLTFKSFNVVCGRLNEDAKAYKGSSLDCGRFLDVTFNNRDNESGYVRQI